MDQGLNSRPGRARIFDDSVDVALLARIAEGDRNALRQLYGTYYHPLLRFICRITGRLDLAQEGVNDVMLVVWRSARAFGGRSTVSTWKLLAASKRWTSRIAGVPFDELIERSDARAEPSEDGELRDLLDAALRHLSAEHRAVVELTYFYGCSYEEIAAIAACPVNTVKTRMFHARAKLKQLLPALGKDGV